MIYDSVILKLDETNFVRVYPVLPRTGLAPQLLRLADWYPRLSRTIESYYLSPPKVEVDKAVERAYGTRIRLPVVGNPDASET
jgi:hypothetical protein